MYKWAAETLTNRHQASTYLMCALTLPVSGALNTTQWNWGTNCLSQTYFSLMDWQAGLAGGVSLRWSPNSSTSSTGSLKLVEKQNNNLYPLLKQNNHRPNILWIFRKDSNEKRNLWSITKQRKSLEPTWVEVQESWLVEEQTPYMEVMEHSWRRLLSQSAPLMAQAWIWWLIAVVSALESAPCKWGVLLSLIQNGESHTTTRPTGLLSHWGRAPQVSKEDKGTYITN